MGIFSRKPRTPEREKRIVDVPKGAFCGDDVVGESEHMNEIRGVLRAHATRADREMGEWDTTAVIVWDTELESLAVRIHDREVGWLDDDTEAALKPLFLSGDRRVDELRCAAHVGWNERIPFAEVKAIGVRVDLAGVLRTA